MEFTGERYVPEMRGNIELEHVHRYLLASEITEGKTVLDIASGEGYGSAMLAEKALQVTGVDLSIEAVKHARKRYKRDNLEFMVGSCDDIPLADASIDLVVSFETIEHHDQHEQMMREIKRVLRPNGILLISSPDKYTYSIEPGYRNSYHVKELYLHEFKHLLGNYFKNTAYFGQRIVYGSNIFAELEPAPILSYLQEDERIKKAHGVVKPIYSIALASDGLLPTVSSSVLEQHINDSEIVRSWSALLTERDRTVAELNDEIVWRREWGLALDQQVRELQNQIDQLISSRSWKVTLVLREANQWKLHPKSQANRYIKAALKRTKALYHRLPFKERTKYAHKMFLKKYIPSLFSVTQPAPQSAAQPAPHTTAQAGWITARLTSVNILASDINLRTSSQPVVSVIIPVYGKCDYTLRCLASISMNPPSVPFEVIVVDDHSLDDSAGTLGQIAGIRLIVNSENQGFIRSCNLGAKAAVGEYVYFLNNDTEVTSGWLDGLIRTFHELPGTGLVGSKLVYPDGTLQEAGGIIWRDGSAWNFGRNHDQLLPVFNYAREVDYCSGASIMLTKALFEECGGFDELYLPAYCEDSDLALKIRERGYRVIYQPLSVVIHYEGVTSGTDTSRGVKAYQVANLKKQFQRWKKRLANHQDPGVDIDSAKDRAATLRVLVIDACTPTPDRDSGSIDTYNILLLLREMGFQATFIPEYNFLYMPRYTTMLQRNGIEVLYAPHCVSVEQHLREFGGRYDLVFLFRLDVMDRHFQTIRKYCSKAKILFDTVDLHHVRLKRESQLLNDPTKQKDADEVKIRELAAMRAADMSVVISTTELEYLQSELPDANIRLLPFSRSIRGTKKGFQERRDIVFVGGYQHLPNVDAIKYFVNDVMPILRRRLPDVCLHVVGSNPPAEVLSLGSDDIKVAGFIEDLPPLLDRMRVNIAPLRYGAGIKGKVGYALTVGLPTVATSLAAEGMSLTDGENILIANDTEAFANAIIRLYRDEPLWNHLSKAGLDYAEQVWGPEAIWNTLHSILSEMGFPIIRGSRPLTLYVPTERASTSDQDANLTPIAAVRTKMELEQALSLDGFEKVRAVQDRLMQSAEISHYVKGFCIPCGKEVFFVVDMQCGGQIIGGQRIPNWQERLVCPYCEMNNRQRLVATLIKQHLKSQPANSKKIYFMEHVTPIFQWAMHMFPQNEIIGSEYLGYEYPSGMIIRGVRHEDVMKLSFADDSLDMIISNDVFEHVPDPDKAFIECARTLRPGGVMLATFPFHQDKDASVTRAEITRKGVKNILPPVYHGNPVSSAGSLVFTDFGWDVLSRLRVPGVKDVCVDIYVSPEYGHLGNGQLVFKVVKE